MTHENARAGFKNLFIAEVLAIIAIVIDVVGSIIALIASAVIPLIGGLTGITWLYS